MKSLHRFLLQVALATVASAQPAPFSTNGVSVGMTVDEAKTALGPDTICGQTYRPWIGLLGSDLSGFKFPFVRMLHSQGKIIVCTGDSLGFCSKTLVRRGQTSERLLEMLGEPDLIPSSGYAGHGDDSPVVSQLYFRWGYVVEALVSNDSFIRTHSPPKDWPARCGRVWRFRVWACDVGDN